MIDSGAFTWLPARGRLAVLAVSMAILTGAGTAVLGESGWHILGAGAYVVATMAALYFPGAIIAQVIAGQLLAASLVLGRDGSTVIFLAMIVSVVATAELLAVVSRSAATTQRDPGDDLRRTVVTLSIASVVFAVVALVGRIPGPSGILAIALASAACVVLAILLVSDAR